MIKFSVIRVWHLFEGGAYRSNWFFTNRAYVWLSIGVHTYLSCLSFDLVVHLDAVIVKMLHVDSCIVVRCQASLGRNRTIKLQTRQNLDVVQGARNNFRHIQRTKTKLSRTVYCLSAYMLIPPDDSILYKVVNLLHARLSLLSARTSPATSHPSLQLWPDDRQCLSPLLLHQSQQLQTLPSDFYWGVWNGQFLTISYCSAVCRLRWWSTKPELWASAIWFPNAWHLDERHRSNVIVH